MNDHIKGVREMYFFQKKEVVIANFSGLVTVFRAIKAHARFTEPELDLYLSLNIDLTRTGLFPLS